MMKNKNNAPNPLNDIEWDISNAYIMPCKFFV